MSIPSLRERLARVTDREALAAALQLGGDALIYLDDSLLLERTRLLNNMFQSTPEDVCGAIAQARPSRQQLITAVATLDSVSQERWVEIAVKAIESQYRGMVPVVVTLDQLDGPLVQLLDGLDPDAAVSMNTVLSDPSTVTPAHACWAARLLYSRVLTMSEPERQILIRGLVQR